MWSVIGYDLEGGDFFVCLFCVDFVFVVGLQVSECFGWLCGWQCWEQVDEFFVVLQYEFCYGVYDVEVVVDLEWWMCGVQVGQGVVV